MLFLIAHRIIEDSVLAAIVSMNFQVIHRHQPYVTFGGMVKQLVTHDSAVFEHCNRA